MCWRIVAGGPEARVLDEAEELVGGEIGEMRKMDGYRE